MSRIRTPENMKIAALQKKQQTVFDPMVSGTGTPWEDRGTHGTVGGFFKTCTASLTSAGKLLESIRRPETNNDARGFLIGISALWGISALLHTGLLLWRDSEQANAIDTDIPTVALFCIIATAAGAGGVFLLFPTYVKIYGRLIAQEKGSPLMPETLLYNVSVYALGPSLLAPIPVIGPIIALGWLFANLVVAGSSRLRLRPAAAFIDATLSLLSVLAIFLAAFGIAAAFVHVSGYYPVTFKVAPKILHR